MTDKPVPSAETVDAFAASWHERMRQEYPEGTPQPPEWDALDPLQRYSMKLALLPLLLAVYPKIVADVLDHYAVQLTVADPSGDVDLYVEWLREQAAQVTA